MLKVNRTMFCLKFAKWFKLWFYIIVKCFIFLASLFIEFIILKLRVTDDCRLQRHCKLVYFVPLLLKFYRLFNLLNDYTELLK